MREQIGIRTNAKIKEQFEAVEGATSNLKLETLLNTYNRVKDVPEAEIIAYSKDLLQQLNINLARMEQMVTPQEPEEIIKTEKLEEEIKSLKEELEHQQRKYKNLNKEYSKLVIEMELLKKGV